MEWLSDLILLTLSATPGLAIAYIIYHQDIHEPEPLHLVIASLVWGSISVFLTIFFFGYLKDLVEFNDQSELGIFEIALIQVALLEEGCKFLFLRGVLFRSKNFNEPFDGIVYAVMIGMGFAITENMLYVFRGQEDALLIRIFTAVPAHAIFGVLMGFFLGKVSMTNKHKTFFSAVSLLSAVLMHGIYDYFLFTSFMPGVWTGAIVALVIGYFYAYRAIRIHQEISPFKESTDSSDSVEVESGD